MVAFGPLLLRTTTSATSRALSRNAKGAARQYRERCGAAAAASEARGAAAPSVSALQHLERRRGISSSARACHGDHEEGFEHAQTVEITWENKDGLKKTTAKCGMNLMRVAHKHGIDLEGACEGVCACSTCHVIMSNEVFDQLPEASEDEEDMLDLAFGLTETSRLGCQVIVTPEMDGIVVKLPAATRNFYVDGHVPQPH
ncbi:unnamed protein product [Ectocarpus sp. 12 AP-2014]